MTLKAGIFLLLSVLTSSTWALYNTNDDVIMLNPSNFNKLVIEDDSIWVVEFYAPWCGHCQSMSPEYKKLANAVKGVIKVGAVNADEHKSLSQQYGVQGFPTIKIFGDNKRSPIDYNGQRTAKGIAEACLAEVKKKIKFGLNNENHKRTKSERPVNNDDVIELTDDNFDKLVMESTDDWLVEFYAPWCGHCKKLAPEWAKAATELKGKVKLGALDATVYQLRPHDYGVKGYPTIKYFPAGKKFAADAVDYSGGRTAEDIVNFALEKYVNSISPPDIVEIIDELSFESACEGKPLCVIAVLPHILDCTADCRYKQLDMLRELGDKYKRKQWGWAWCEALSQPELEASVEIGGFGYPALAAVNYKKMKFSVLRGPFSKDGINEFLRDISFGRGQTVHVKGAKKPKISTVKAWDGMDGIPPYEEEIDLSDVKIEGAARKTEL